MKRLYQLKDCYQLIGVLGGDVEVVGGNHIS